MSPGPSPSTAAPTERPTPAPTVRRVLLAAGMGLLLVVLLTSTFAGAFGRPVAGSPGAPLSVGHLASYVAHPRSAPPHPLAPIPTAAAPAFFSNTTSNSLSLDSYYGQATCPTSTYYYTCDPWALQPSLLSLANGQLGLVYEIGNASTTPNVCGGIASGNGDTRLAFTNSTDNGTTWATGYLLNQSNQTCPYFDQLEPSFTTNTSGGIVGVYIGANVTLANATSNSCGFYCAYPPGLYSNYTNRSGDALVFVSSSNDGANFTNGTVLTAAGHNLADPHIATFGDTIYIVYENISNTSAASPQVLPGYYPYSPSPDYAVSVWMIESVNGGATWNAPVQLPGQNASQYYNAMSPTVAVSSAGTVAVAYLTNRSCIAYCAGPPSAFTEYGDNVVVVTSTSNGSAWSGISTVAQGVGEPVFGGLDDLFNDNLLFNVFQYAPQPVLAWNTTGNQLYVAWSGSYNISSPNTVYYGQNYDWADPAIFAGTSPNAGASWTVNRITDSGTSNYIYPNYTLPSWTANPGLAVVGGVVYLTYYYQNETYSYGGGGALCGYYGPSGGAGGNLFDASVQYLVTSGNGVNFSAPGSLDYYNNYGNPNAGLGTTSSIVVANGSPVAAFSFPTGYVCPYYCGDASDVAIGTLFTGPTTNVTFELNFSFTIPNGSVEWVGLAGAPFAVTNAGLTVTGVPEFFPFSVNVSAPPQNAPGIIVLATGGGSYYLLGPTNISVGGQAYTTLNLSMVPFVSNFGWNVYNTSYYLSEYFYQYIYFSTYPSPSWYQYAYGSCIYTWGDSILIPAFTPVTIGFYNYSDVVEYDDGFGPGVPPAVVSGFGPGNYTGTQANFTVNATGPITETLDFYPSGTYNVSVAAPTLPAGTPYSFSWDGASHSSPSGGNVTLTNVSTGYHYIANITANSTTAGWVYAGYPDQGNPLYVPAVPFVTLSFAYIDVGAPTGTVSFFAPDFTPGTVWQLSLNNTVYASATPWINVTTHSGTYPISAYPVTSANGSAQYVPDAIGPTISVTTGDTYDVNYTPAFSVAAIASTGGSVTPGGSQLYATGANLQFTATAASGFYWIGWTGIGVGSYTGTSLEANVTVDGPIVETANFAPLPSNHFTLTVNEVGITNGTTWSIDLNGVGYSGSTSSIQVPDLYGCGAPPAESTYHLYIPQVNLGSGSNLTRFVPGSYATSFCLPKTITVTFATEYYLTLTASTGGSAAAAVGAGGFGGSAWVSSDATVNLRETPSIGYAFTEWLGNGTGSYTGTQPLPSFQMIGPMTESAIFSQLPPPPPPPRFTETFTLAAPFATGTVWSVSLGSGLTFVSNGNEVNATGLLANTYSVVVATVYAPDHLTQYTPTTASFSLPVHQNGTRQLAFETAYWFSIGSSGPGTASASLAPGFHAANSPITLTATPFLGDAFVGWTGIGSSAFTGTGAIVNLTLKSPITETAAFAPLPGSTTKTTSAPSPWTSLTAEAGLAILGLVVGVVVGILLARRRSPPGARSEAPPPSGDPDLEPPPPSGGTP
jgi:hypothetical protein